MVDTSMLAIRDLRAGYGEAVVVHGVTIDVNEGEFVAIIGPNGAGKTTLLRAVMGLATISSGDILFRGSTIRGLPPHEIVRKGLVMVPEGRRIFPNMSVLENLLMGAFLIRERRRVSESLQRVYRLFPILEERRGQLAGSLSGGEQQMLAIARALMLDPLMLILDEPSVGLAPRIVDRLYEALVLLNNQGMTLMVVEQNIGKILSIAKRAYVMQHGRIVMHETASILASNPGLISAYLTRY